MAFCYRFFLMCKSSSTVNTKIIHKTVLLSFNISWYVSCYDFFRIATTFCFNCRLIECILYKKRFAIWHKNNVLNTLLSSNACILSFSLLDNFEKSSFFYVRSIVNKTTKSKNMSHSFHVNYWHIFMSHISDFLSK
jgi:hypothetical protein